MKLQRQFVLSAAAALVMLAPAAHAQNKTVANVPFDFTVADVTLPAGEYAVQPESPGGLIEIHNVATRKTVLVMAARTLSAYKGTTDGTGRLIFHRYGDRYFFSEVWSLGGPCGGVAPTKLERELRTNGDAKQMASILIPLTAAAR